MNSDITKLDDNPFTPLFGIMPPIIVGRNSVLDRVSAALASSAASPELCSIFTGVRGSGKTTMLKYLASQAEMNGWIAVSTVASPGMLEDLLERARSASAHLINAESSKHLTGINFSPIGGVSWDNSQSPKGNWRTEITNLLEQLEDHDIGLLFIVDEVNRTQEEMVQLTTVFQMLLGEGRKVALLMAGLPFAISALLSGKTTSFLRRAQKFTLGPLNDYDVKDALLQTIQNGGKRISNDALQLATKNIHGFPYLFQLIGFRSWNASGSKTEISVEDVVNGTFLANEEMNERIFESTISELSDGDLEFLGAMNMQKPQTLRAEIAEKLNRPSAWISRYKKRLIEAGVIDERRKGTYEFTLPGFSEYLKNRF